MTREISEIADDVGFFTYHITSLKPLNPNNIADSFEQTALNIFEKEDAKEYYVKTKQDGRTLFRYMGRLLTEKSCLSCHAEQGYKLGEVRGGISVSFDISDVEKQVSRDKLVVIIVSVTSVFFLLVMIYYHVYKIMHRLQKAQDEIERLTITDELTGLYNRRYFNEKLAVDIAQSKRYKHNLSCVLLDLDHFKNVNDTYGHGAGDIVLASIAQTIRQSCRASDQLARYGGEEFIILMPETDRSGANIATKKIQDNIRALDIDCGNSVILKVTASFGIASFTPEDLNAENISDKIPLYADKALYTAKERGRNKIVMYEG